MTDRTTTGRVEGRVVDAGRQPVGGASVVVVRSAGPHPDLAARTLDDGSFRLGRLPVGPAVLEARKAGATGRADVRVGDPGAVEIQIA